MMRTIVTPLLGLLSVAVIALAPSGCQSGGVGDPCIPEDEYNTDFAGFKLTEENIESRSFQCQTRICLVNHFQGRVTCPLGQAEAPTSHTPGNCQTAAGGTGDCCIPGTDIPVQQSVCGQCSKDSRRDADDAVYCSCRCGVAEGEPDDPSFNFCECPDGFECSEIRRNVGISDKQITGKYCIRTGSAYKGSETLDRDCGTVQGTFDATKCDGSAP